MADAMRSGVNVSNLFSATAGNSSLNSDDYLAIRVYIGAHLPALADGGWRMADGGNSTTVTRSPATWSELIEAGSNMGLPVPYELLWRHSIP